MEATFVVHDWCIKERVPEIESVVEEAALLCLESLGQTPVVPLTITYIDAATLDAFWRVPSSGGVDRLCGESVLAISVANMVYLAAENRLVLRADGLLGSCPDCLRRDLIGQIFQHVLQTQVGLGKAEVLRTILSEEFEGVVCVFRDLGVNCFDDPESCLAAMFAEWTMPRDDDELPLVLTENAVDRLQGLFERLQVDPGELNIYPYSWLLELCEETLGDLLAPVASPTATVGEEEG